MKVEFFPQAATDIIRQFRYYLVDCDSAVTAIRFREALMESIKQLKPHPRMGLVVRGSIPGLRSWPVAGFRMIRIYYATDRDSLRVIRVLHGNRDVRQILKRERPPKD